MKPMHLMIAGLCLAVAPSLAVAQQTDDKPLPDPVPFQRDSGFLDNTGLEPTTLYSESILVPGAAWIRVYFGDVELAEGSFLRITSELDGEVQVLDAAALEIWSRGSAYFNGDAVTVELVAGADTKRNRLEIVRLAYDEAPPVEPSLCGADDRVSSEVEYAARILPNGCSSAVWNEESCIISAGHCFPSSAQVIEFRVPLNNQSCQWQHPPVDDQFPILQKSWTNGGIGNDWAVATTGTNGLGQRAYDRYGIFRPIALTVPGVGTEMTIWGYGSDTECLVDNTQQRSDGEITVLTSTYVAHNADTTGGNSGSGVIHDGTIISVHTHAGCPQNRSTRIDLPAFANARASLCLPEAGTVELDRAAYSCTDSMTIVVEDRSLNGAGTAAVTVASDSEPAGERLDLNEPYAAVFFETFPTADTAAVPKDGVLSVTHGETITVTYDDSDDGTGSPGTSITTAVADCLGPVINGVSVGSIDAHGATITWTTDEPSTSVVDADGPGGGFVTSDEALTTLHGIVLEGLVACSTYTFSVGSADAVGNLTTDDNGGNDYSFETLCLNPPPVPDGRNGSTPMTVGLAGAIPELFWDNQCLASGTTKILYGSLQDVSQHTIQGAVCGIPAEDDSALLSTLLLGDIWFVVVKDNGKGQEGSWGQSTAGERNGASASGACGALDKDLLGTCP